MPTNDPLAADTAARNDSRTDPTLTRRRVLALVGSTGAGMTALLAVDTDTAVAADVTMGELAVSGDSETLGQAPAEVSVAVSGQYDVQAPSAVPQTRVALHVTANGETAQLDEQVNLNEPMAGGYSLAGDLLGHPAVSGSWFVPAAGETVERDVTVAVELSVVEDGSVTHTTAVEQAVTLTLTGAGVELSLGGSGSVDVVPA